MPTNRRNLLVAARRSLLAGLLGTALADPGTAAQRIWWPEPAQPESGHLLNGSFDATVAGWVVTDPVNVPMSWDAMDAAGNPNSGSALVVTSAIPSNRGVIMQLRPAIRCHLHPARTDPGGLGTACARRQRRDLPHRVVGIHLRRQLVGRQRLHGVHRHQRSGIQPRRLGAGHDDPHHARGRPVDVGRTRTCSAGTRPPASPPASTRSPSTSRSTPTASKAATSWPGTTSRAPSDVAPHLTVADLPGVAAPHEVRSAKSRPTAAWSIEKTVRMRYNGGQRGHGEGTRGGTRIRGSARTVHRRRIRREPSRRNPPSTRRAAGEHDRRCPDRPAQPDRRDGRPLRRCPREVVGERGPGARLSPSATERARRRPTRTLRSLVSCSRAPPRVCPTSSAPTSCTLPSETARPRRRRSATPG